MKTIIAGSRQFVNANILYAGIGKTEWTITEVVSGGARGIDSLGERWAAANNIPVKLFLANWKVHGNSAGYKRNVEMANYAEALLAIWDGRSPGTAHMISIAKDKGLRIYVYLNPVVGNTAIKIPAQVTE
jgi:hypothetical protein